MRTHNREILIYYNPESASDRKTIAHARSMVRHVRSYSHSQSPSTGMSWEQILGALCLNDPKELLNKAHPYYQQNIRGRDFDDEGWLKIFQKNPDLIIAPIAIRGNRVVLCKTPTDIYKLI